jgi:hypothetical protein
LEAATLAERGKGGRFAFVGRASLGVALAVAGSAVLFSRSVVSGRWLVATTDHQSLSTDHYYKEQAMSAYELQTVIKMWELGELTTEQAIGQILMLIKEREERLQELEGRVAALRRALDGGGTQSK